MGEKVMQYFDTNIARGKYERPPLEVPPSPTEPWDMKPLVPIYPTQPANAPSTKQYKDFEENQQKLTLQTLLRQTGLGIKIRFLLALTLTAVFPAIVLVILLGDPSGQEQRASLGQSLMLQAQAQANALDQAITARQYACSH